MSVVILKESVNQRPATAPNPNFKVSVGEKSQVVNNAGSLHSGIVTDNGHIQRSSMVLPGGRSQRISTGSNPGSNTPKVTISAGTTESNRSVVLGNETTVRRSVVLQGGHDSGRSSVVKLGDTSGRSSVVLHGGEIIQAGQSHDGRQSVVLEGGDSIVIRPSQSGRQSIIVNPTSSSGRQSVVIQGGGDVMQRGERQHVVTIDPSNSQFLTGPPSSHSQRKHVLGLQFRETEDGTVVRASSPTVHMYHDGGTNVTRNKRLSFGDSYNTSPVIGKRFSTGSYDGYMSEDNTFQTYLESGTYPQVLENSPCVIHGPKGSTRYSKSVTQLSPQIIEVSTSPQRHSTSQPSFTYPSFSSNVDEYSDTVLVSPNSATLPAPRIRRKTYGGSHSATPIGYVDSLPRKVTYHTPASGRISFHEHTGQRMGNQKTTIRRTTSHEPERRISNEGSTRDMAQINYLEPVGRKTSGDSNSGGPKMSRYRSEVYIPIHKDDLNFEDRQRRLWAEMDDKMEQRRRQWEDEIDRMRNEFFTLKPLDMGTSRMGIERADNLETAFVKDANGMPRFKVRFDVHEFKSDEITVQTYERRLIVKAKHTEKGNSSSVTREFSRQIDLPKSVDPQQLEASVTKDGILVVEAPVPAPDYSAPIQSGFRKPLILRHDSSGFSPVVVNSDGSRALHLEIDVGTQYKPEEVNVKTVGHKIVITARHEEKAGNRTSFCEFSKEYELPSDVDPYSVNAFLQDDGKLVIEAPVDGEGNPEALSPSNKIMITVKRR